jgi:hypothetical protein
MNGDSNRICYIHVGTHKTGTTSIQAFLAGNRAGLEARGLFVPRAGGNGDPAFACHHQIVRELVESTEFDLRQGGLDAVAAELERTDARVACLSSEDFSLIYDRPELLAVLRDRISAAGFVPKIIVYLRPQVSYSVAVYATNVYSGFRVLFDDYVRDLLEYGRYVWNGGFGPPLEYDKLLAGFEAVFGRASITVRRFCSDARDSALLLSFLRILLPETKSLAAFVVDKHRANRTLTFPAVLDLLGRPSGIDTPFRFAPVTLGDIRKLHRRFGEPNRRLYRDYGIRIPVFEPSDVLRALPLRKTPAQTRRLNSARKLVRRSTTSP